jgi:hypothetical protein
MKIRMHEKLSKKKININLPLCILTNPLVLEIITRMCKGLSAAGLTGSQIRQILNGLRRCKQILNGKPLVDIQSGNGDSVLIIL